MILGHITWRVMWGFSSAAVFSRLTIVGFFPIGTMALKSRSNQCVAKWWSISKWSHRECKTWSCPWRMGWIWEGGRKEEGHSLKNKQTNSISNNLETSVSILVSKKCQKFCLILFTTTASYHGALNVQRAWVLLRWLRKKWNSVPQFSSSVNWRNQYLAQRGTVFL